MESKPNHYEPQEVFVVLSKQISPAADYTSPEKNGLGMAKSNVPRCQPQSNALAPDSDSVRHLGQGCYGSNASNSNCVRRSDMFFESRHYDLKGFPVETGVYVRPADAFADST
jgi:hypothetical protein